MKKIRTFEDLEQRLTDDLSWRRKELFDLHFRTQLENQAIQELYRRRV